MRDGQGCLLPTLRCYRLLEEEQAYMVQLLLPRICRAEVAHDLQDVKSSNLAEERRKKPRRTMPKSSKVGSKASDANTAIREVVGIIDSFQEDAVTAGEMVGVVTACGPVAVQDGAGKIAAPPECSSNQDQESAWKTDEVHSDEEVADTSYLPGLDDSAALRCLAFLPLAQHWRLAMLSRRHRDLIRDSLLLKLRHEYHIVESSSLAEERRKKPRRTKPKSNKVGSKSSDASVVIREGAGIIDSFQEDAVTTGEMVGVVTACGPVSVQDGAGKFAALPECSSNQDQESAGKTDEVHSADTSYLPGLDDSAALRCLAFLPLMQHRRLAMLSRRHRDLVRDSLLLKLRQEYHIVEQWICIYTSGNNGWTAFDPKQNTWRNLPHANVDPIFDLSDKESLSAGTHLLWLGREVYNFACYKYDLVSNSWEIGPPMLNPRCLFASASCGEFAFVAGGFGGTQLNVLNTAERYNSLKGIWEPLPPMATPRQKCSGFFMDGKFYVIGGKTRNHVSLTSGEEYDPEKNAWRTIENMYSAPASTPSFEPSPPLVAVAGNQLYAIESSSNLLKVYEKHTNTWKVLGPVPVRADFCNGWGLAFKALGDQLFVIGGHRISTEEREGVAVFSWRPQPGASAPEWQIVNLRDTGTGNFLFNCAVMAC